MIAAIIGLAGSGKTLFLTRQIATYDMVICNYKLNESLLKKQKILYVKDVEDFFGFGYMDVARDEAKHGKHVILAIDEAGLFFPTQAFKKMPASFMYLFAQHRKLGVDMYYTAQSLRQVNTILRVNTMLTYEMAHLGPLFYFSVWDRDWVRRKGALQWRGMFVADNIDKTRYNTLEMLDGADWYIRSTEEVKAKSKILLSTDAEDTNNS